MKIRNIYHSGCAAWPAFGWVQFQQTVRRGHAWAAVQNTEHIFPQCKRLCSPTRLAAHGAEAIGAAIGRATSFKDLVLKFKQSLVVAPNPLDFDGFGVSPMPPVPSLSTPAGSAARSWSSSWRRAIGANPGSSGDAWSPRRRTHPSTSSTAGRSLPCTRPLASGSAQHCQQSGWAHSPLARLRHISNVGLKDRERVLKVCRASGDGLVS